jgi:DNA processing protein
MDAPQYITREALAAHRGDRDFAWSGPGVWVSGHLEGLQRPSVAIVGTRAATSYGRHLARTFARELAEAGCCIVSGLALGIDAAAHEGALDAGGATIGVLGGGHAAFFPRRNAALAQRMLAAGAVISSYAPAVTPRPGYFLERNALVAALADAVVVIEAPARSGALNTAHWAAERIPVLAVPGDVDRAHVQGCLALIRDGAILARCAADVREVLGLEQTAAARARIARGGLGGELARALAAGEAGLDALVDATGASPADILAALAMLELEGAVERRGARYALLC